MLAQTGEFTLHGVPVIRDRRHMSLPSRLAVAALLVVALAAWVAWTSRGTVRSDAVADEATPPLAPGVVASLGRRPSHNGRYHATVLTTSHLAVGVRQTWTIRLTRGEHRRLAHAHVAVRSWMPETGERSPVAATARHLGEGRYRVDGIYFSRPGWWNVALVLDGADGADSVAFNVILPPPSQVAGR